MTNADIRHHGRLCRSGRPADAQHQTVKPAGILVDPVVAQLKPVYRSLGRDSMGETGDLKAVQYYIRGADVHSVGALDGAFTARASALNRVDIAVGSANKAARPDDRDRLGVQPRLGDQFAAGDQLIHTGFQGLERRSQRAIARLRRVGIHIHPAHQPRVQTLVLNHRVIVLRAHRQDVRIVLCRHLLEDGDIAHIGSPGVAAKTQVAAFQHPTLGLVHIVVIDHTTVRPAHVTRLAQVMDSVAANLQAAERPGINYHRPVHFLVANLPLPADLVVQNLYAAGSNADDAVDTGFVGFLDDAALDG